MNAHKSCTEQWAPTLDVTGMTGHADEAGALLKAMASTPRLLILCQLVAGERSVGALLSEIPLSASALSQHLAILRQESLVTTRRSAQTIYYALSPGPAVEIISILHTTFCTAYKPDRPGKRTI